MFKKVIENFICEHCKAEVKGNGFTNHCLVCLWSKHVDVDPGDRKESCQGMMEPVGVESSRAGVSIVYRCVTCKTLRRNKVSKDDNFDAILALSRKVADTFSNS